MQFVYDPQNSWVGLPALLRKPLRASEAPIAVRDTLILVQDSGPATVQPLLNDSDPGDLTLTLVSAYAALGTAEAQPDGSILYTPLPGFSGTDTVIYEVSNSLGIIDAGQIDVTVAPPALSIAVTSLGTLEVTADAGPVDISVTAPAEYAVSATVETGDLAGGPLNLVGPDITGPRAPGDTLTATSGLWVHDAADAPVRSWQWQRSGADIAGATQPDYTVTAADEGLALSVVETLSDAAGQRSATGIIPAGTFQPGDDAALLGWWDADDTASLTETAGAVSSWANKAGGVALAQETVTRQPLTGTRLLNGRNVLDFDGNMHLDADVTLPVSGDVAFHMAFILDTTTVEYEAVLSANAADDFQIDAGATGQFDGRLNVAGIGATTGLTGGPFQGAMILSAIFDRTGSATAEVFLGGLSRGVMAYTAPLSAATTLRVMSNRSANAWITGAVAEVIVTGITNRAAYHDYLAAKWGIA